MSDFTETVQAKCLAFGDRIIKLNDYLLAQAAQAHDEYNNKRRKKNLSSKVLALSSDSSKFLPLSSSAVPVYLQSVSNLCDQLLRSGTSIGANNAEAINAISKQDYRSKSFIALKEARESLYWIDLLHRNGYIDDKQYQSIYTDCEELVKLLVTRCKKLNNDTEKE